MQGIEEVSKCLLRALKGISNVQQVYIYIYIYIYIMFVVHYLFPYLESLSPLIDLHERKSHGIFSFLSSPVEYVLISKFEPRIWKGVNKVAIRVLWVEDVVSSHTEPLENMWLLTPEILLTGRKWRDCIIKQAKCKPLFLRERAIGQKHNTTDAWICFWQTQGSSVI